ARSRERRASDRSSAESSTRPAVTAHGRPSRLDANDELPEDAARARLRGAEGIGLYRSEFLLAGTGEEELGSIEADTLGAAQAGARRVLGQLVVRVEAARPTVGCDRRPGAGLGGGTVGGAALSRAR